MKINFLILSVFLILFSANTFGQSGGAFEITQSVTASGGGQNAAGGEFALDSTIGQSAAGNVLNGAPFAVTSGFWTFTQLSPTAASVRVSGRVRNSFGRGIPRAIVVMQNASGTVRATKTNQFGYYLFENIEVGETYIFDVRSKAYTFAPIVINIVENLTGIDFTSF